MWQVIGHERTVETLQRSIAGDRLAHALLLVGPDRIGKTRLALELAKALNCTGTDPPCQTCRECRQIESGSHPDVTVVSRAEGKDSIAIQQVRELRDVASLRPFQARRKVYIIAGAEALTDQAADALLKTLEEPQPQLTLILTAADENALPATVVSRCRVLQLHPVETPSIIDALAGQGVETPERIARLSRGSVGWALEAARQPKLAAQQEELIARLSGVLDMNLDQRLQLAESLAADRKDRGAIRASIEMLTLLAHDLLLLTQGLPPRLSAGGTRDMLSAQAARLSLPQIHAYLEDLRVAMDRIDRNVDPRLTLEALLIAAP